MTIYGEHENGNGNERFMIDFSLKEGFETNVLIFEEIERHE